MHETHPKIHTAGAKRRILIIEDEPINLEMLRFMLEDRYEILAAMSGGQGLDILQKEAETISLILLDLNLPDIHGLDVLREIKSISESTIRLPVIVMTAEKTAEVESLTLGAIDFIPKPYPAPEVIRARIQRTIELSEDRDIIRATERDRLTGLYTREFFYRYAAQYDTFFRDEEMDALVIDINHFHMFNERFGRHKGDEALRCIGKKLLEILEDSGGIACRRAGDTFLVYCPHRNDYEKILELASALDQDGSSKDDSRIRLRMGVYRSVDKSIDMERRFDRAKMAADTVKDIFTGAVGIYDNSMQEEEVLAEQLIDDFHTAIREKQFVVYYQPKFAIQQNEPRLSSAEALIRWKHPKLGMINPGVFIPLFEKNGLIQELDYYVWGEAAAQIREWKEHLGVTLPVSVNVSRVDIYDPQFEEKLQAFVRDNALECSEVLLEITESAYAEDSAQIIEKVMRLREDGFLVEMDDFGSGYSSLNMLSVLPIDALKLDMEFIRTAFRERKDTRLLEAVIRLADSLGVPTIAEGVETAEQMLTLKNMGCDIVQGYFFSRPLPPEEFEEFVKAKKKGVLTPRRQEKKMPRDQFTYDALHDPMTGLYNHSAFEILFHDSDQEHIAVVLVNVDDYAAVRETKGRKYADQMALRTAEVLRGNFRSVDHICRLKEDEFVIIVSRVTGDMHDLVFDKVRQVREILQSGENEPEPVFLSVGIAFSDREKPGSDIFVDADAALEKMISEKKHGCAVF